MRNVIVLDVCVFIMIKPTEWGNSIFVCLSMGIPTVMGCYSTQSELARHDSRAHVQQLTIFSITPACFARHATREVNITPTDVISLLHFQGSGGRGWG